ncbi:hypothetical protein FE236_00990 [Mariprofundus erugo]|uniref:hypothetical protein n=1 Tax=Mariprofundus erugo TaxID=2528639 RepID=UPI0010FF2C66|nr:hypothetical protein [Mariprofundus erugo]TLS78359.1 hypothetical protein FE236_00990 [Mariprofundus erugo]
MKKIFLAISISVMAVLPTMAAASPTCGEVINDALHDWNASQGTAAYHAFKKRGDQFGGALNPILNSATRSDRDAKKLKIQVLAPLISQVSYNAIDAQDVGERLFDYVAGGYIGQLLPFCPDAMKDL